MHRYYKIMIGGCACIRVLCVTGSLQRHFFQQNASRRFPMALTLHPPAQGSRMHFHQMQINVALLFQLTIWMRGVRMTCLYTSWCRWEKNGKGAMFSVHTDLWEKKEEELGAVHQQDLSVMEKVIIASESMASNFQIQSIIAQIVKKLLQFFYFLAYPIYLVYAGVGVRCLTFHMFGLFFPFFAHPPLFLSCTGCC